jgi:hypothetical protein
MKSRRFSIVLVILLAVSAEAELTPSTTWFYEAPGQVCFDFSNLPPRTTDYFIQLSTNTKQTKAQIIQTYNKAVGTIDNLRAWNLKFQFDGMSTSTVIDHLQRENYKLSTENSILKTSTAAR